MRRAVDNREFVTTPVGRYVAGRGWALWTADPACCGSVVWGRLDDAAVAQALAPFDSLFSPEMAPRCDLVTEASRLEGIDPSAFQRFATYIARRLPQMAERIARHAIVRPAGVPGALVAGFYEVSGRPPYPTRLFTTAVEAFVWLGRRDARSLADELGAIAADQTLATEELRKLHALLATRLDLSLSAAARAIGTSTRSLQRRLRAAGTSFRAEVDVVRIRTAGALLADTDQKITTIALDVGCATPQHFSALFRRLTGETPSGWRARQRAGASP
jgi:AraC-like DNA-binding protein